MTAQWQLLEILKNRYTVSPEYVQYDGIFLYDGIFK